MTLSDPTAAARDVLADLLARTANQDSLAFAELYRATSPKLYGVIARILGRGPLAEEVLQDVYVRVWARAGDFEPWRASAVAWLAAIARNRAIDEARRSTPRQVELSEDDLRLADHPEPLAGRERNERLQALLRCLSALEPGRRRLILLAYYRGLSREELASQVGRPVSTIKTWLHRSLSQLRICLAQ